MQRFAVIMAGGSGERFWPASRRARPKQLLRLTDPDVSMLEEAIDRISPLIPAENIVIATNEILADPIADALPQLRRENVLAEPAKRNTAACLAFAAAHLQHQYGDPADMTMAVLTADHDIKQADRFRETVDAALRFAGEQDALVTIGVVPTRPETGYGYIEVAEAPAPGDALAVQPVAHFREKPDHPTAERFVASGRHLWNAGMFFWRVSSFLDGLERHMPKLRQATEEMRQAFSGTGPSMVDTFSALDDVPVDIGLMEAADNVFVIRADFPWDDVGAWDALARTRERDGDGNVITGAPVLIDTRNSIVFNDAGDEMAVCVVGLEDVVVATTKDGILVCPKDRAQDVKKAVAALRERGSDKVT